MHPDLATLDLFADADPAALMGLAGHLAPVSFRPGQLLVREGERGRACAILLSGSAVVSRDGRDVAEVGPGSVIGELAMLTRSRRQATVRARTPVDAVLADVADFDVLLGVPGVRDRLARIATGRIATNATPVPAALRDGSPAWLRPLLPTDRTGIAAALAHQSAESLRRRFFTEVKVTERLVDFLVDIDYLHHFAWVVGTGTDTGAGAAGADGPVDDGGEQAMGVGRYVRVGDPHADGDGPPTAEVAFHVGDRFQGRGVGRLLVGALGPAAQAAGIERFTADVLYDNAPMRALLDGVGARWQHAEPGVSTATYPVDAATRLLDPAVADHLRTVAADVLAVGRGG